MKYFLLCLILALVLFRPSCSDTSPADTENKKDQVELYNPEAFESFEDNFDTGYYFGEDEYDDNHIDEDRRIHKPLNTAVGAAYGVIAVVGLLANGVVFFVIFGSNEIHKTVTAMYVIQLAVADSAFLLTLPIFGIHKITENWTFGQFTCSFCSTLKFLNYYAGIFFLTAMSVDRYIAVAYSTKANQLRTRQRTGIICAIVWAVSTVMSIPIMIFSKLETVFEDTKCRIMFPGYMAFNDSDAYIYFFEESFFEQIDNSTEFKEEVGNYTEDMLPSNDEYFLDTTSPSHLALCSHNNKSSNYPIWLVINFIIGFVIPFCIISISYILILVRLRASEERIATMTGKRTQIMRKRVTRMVAVLVICFVICWLPYHIFTLAKIRGLDISVSACNGIEQFVVAFGFSNSAINPILYSFLGHNFRERLQESITLTKRRLRRGSSAVGLTVHPTRSHSDHGTHTAFPRRFSQMIGFRRGVRLSSSGENNPVTLKEVGENQKIKHGIPLVNITKKRDWKHGKNQRKRTDCVSASHTNQTEFTRIPLDKDTPKKGRIVSSARKL